MPLSPHRDVEAETVHGTISSNVLSTPTLAVTKTSLKSKIFKVTSTKPTALSAGILLHPRFYLQSIQDLHAHFILNKQLKQKCE
jgi:hypothetical protein